jgi:pre-mRNA-splicing factor SPF27
VLIISYKILIGFIYRIINLEIMSEYGAQSWRIYNQTLKTMLDQAEKQLDELKKKIQQINLSRKNEQLYAGNQLRALEQSYVNLKLSYFA